MRDGVPGSFGPGNEVCSGGSSEIRCLLGDESCGSPCPGNKTGISGMRIGEEQGDSWGSGNEVGLPGEMESSCWWRNSNDALCNRTVMLLSVKVSMTSWPAMSRFVGSAFASLGYVLVPLPWELNA